MAPTTYCGICENIIKTNGYSILCTGPCGKWVHKNCSELSTGEIQKLQSTGNCATWKCKACVKVTLTLHSNVNTVPDIANSESSVENQAEVEPEDQEGSINTKNIAHIVHTAVNQAIADLKTEIVYLRQKVDNLAQSNIDLIKLLNPQVKTGSIAPDTCGMEANPARKPAKTTTSIVIPTVPPTSSVEEKSKVNVLLNANSKSFKPSDHNIAPNASPKVLDSNISDTALSFRDTVAIPQKPQHIEAGNDLDPFTTVLSRKEKQRLKNSEAKNNHNNTIEKQSQRSNNKRPPIVGSATDSSLKACEKIEHLHVSRLHPSVTCNEIVAHLKSKNIREVSCMQLQSKYPDTYSSFKVSMPSTLLDSVRHADLWPTGAIVNCFLGYLRSHRRGK